MILFYNHHQSTKFRDAVKMQRIRSRTRSPRLNFTSLRLNHLRNHQNHRTVLTLLIFKIALNCIADRHCLWGYGCHIKLCDCDVTRNGYASVLSSLITSLLAICIVFFPFVPVGVAGRHECETPAYRKNCGLENEYHVISRGDWYGYGAVLP